MLLTLVGKSLAEPLKLFDPTLEPHQVREGMIEVAILVGTFGSGKLLVAASKTASGTRLLVRFSHSVRKLKVAVHGLRQSMRVGVSSKQYKSAAAACEALMKHKRFASNPKAVEKLRLAKDRYERCATYTEKMGRYREKALKANEAVQAAKKSKASAETMMKLTEEALAASKEAQKAYATLYVYRVGAAKADHVARQL